MQMPENFNIIASTEKTWTLFQWLSYVITAQLSQQGYSMFIKNKVYNYQIQQS